MRKLSAAPVARPSETLDAMSKAQFWYSVDSWGVEDDMVFQE